MKKCYMLLAAAVFIFTGLRVNAQNGNGNGGGNGFGQLIKSSPADATLLFENYANPLFKGLGTGLNSGWNNTAKTKKFLHFDLRITANVAQVPTSDQRFDVTKIGLSIIYRSTQHPLLPSRQLLGAVKMHRPHLWILKTITAAPLERLICLMV